MFLISITWEPIKRYIQRSLSVSFVRMIFLKCYYYIYTYGFFLLDCVLSYLTSMDEKLKQFSLYNLKSISLSTQSGHCEVGFKSNTNRYKIASLAETACHRSFMRVRVIIRKRRTGTSDAHCAKSVALADNISLVVLLVITISDKGTYKQAGFILDRIQSAVGRHREPLQPIYSKYSVSLYTHEAFHRNYMNTCMFLVGTHFINIPVLIPTSVRV